MIRPSQSQWFVPKMAEMGASVARGLNHMALRFIELSVFGSVSLVTYASICIWRLDMSYGVVLDNGRIRSSIVRSEEFLNAQIKVTFGSLHRKAVDIKISSRIMDMNGVMPLPPLTMTRLSCLQKFITC